MIKLDGLFAGLVLGRWISSCSAGEALLTDRNFDIPRTEHQLIEETDNAKRRTF